LPKNFCKCGVEILKKSKMCQSCLGKSKRRVERPDRNILLKEIEEFGYSKVGIKYGVSGNSIKKWVKINIVG
jgi:hypothetical protein